MKGMIVEGKGRKGRMVLGLERDRDKYRMGVDWTAGRIEENKAVSFPRGVRFVMEISRSCSHLVLL